MVLIDRGASVEHFAYSRLGDEWALLRLLTSLGTQLEPPTAAHLAVEPEPGGDLFYAVARAGSLERRLLAHHRGGDSELLWRATFALPLEVVEAPDALFRVLGADGFTLALPTPGLRFVSPRQLPLRSPRYRPQRDASWPSLGQARQRFAALATAVVVTATSTPVAFAAGDRTTPASTTAPGAAMTSATTTPSTPSATTTASTPLPASPAVSSQRLVAVAPTTSASATRHAPSSPLVHLSWTPSRPAHHASPKPIRGIPGCHTRVRAGAVAYAATHPASRATRAIRLKCPAPSGSAPGGRRHAPNPAPPTFSTGSPATGGRPTTTSGTTTSGPPHRRHKPGHASPPHHATASHPSGGEPIATAAPTSGTSPTSTPGSVPTLSSSAPGLQAPKGWTGTVTSDPALTGAVTNLSGLLSNGNRPPSFLIPIYMEAGRRYGVPWEVLAGINAIESDYGRNMSTSSAGAIGWMQFEPSTWHQYGMAVDGHSVPNPYDPRDAIYSAARYLAAAGAAKDISTAVFAYNHASWYVDEVMSRARAIAGHVQYDRATRTKRGTLSVDFATGVKTRPTVRYRGGVLSHYDRLISAANMVSAANFPYLYGGGHEQPARFAPFDCSGSVSYVMQQAGYNVPTTVSGEIPVWKFPTGPGAVTIFYNPVHTFMRIGNRFFGTSGFARPSGGAGWFDVDKLPAGYLAQFREVHVPGLGANSFAPGTTLPAFPSVRKAPASQSWSSFRSEIKVWMSTLGPFPHTQL